VRIPHSLDGLYLLTHQLQRVLLWLLDVLDVLMYLLLDDLFLLFLLLLT
jgi:hypothetical protein